MELTDAVPLDKVPYLDFPTLQFNEHESTEMPFRYVKGQDDQPIMPKVKVTEPLLRNVFNTFRRE